MTNQLPPLPVDPTSLDLIYAIVTGADGATQSALSAHLDWLAEMGGSDITAVEQNFGIDEPVVYRDSVYHHNDLIARLIEEIRRLRSAPEFRSITRQPINARANLKAKCTCGHPRSAHSDLGCYLCLNTNTSSFHSFHQPPTNYHTTNRDEFDAS